MQKISPVAAATLPRIASSPPDPSKLLSLHSSISWAKSSSRSSGKPNQSGISSHSKASTLVRPSYPRLQLTFGPEEKTLPFGTEEKIPQSGHRHAFQMALRKDSAIDSDRPAVFVRGKYALIISAYAISKRNVLKCYDSQRVLPHLVSANLATLGLDTQRLCGEDAFHVTCGVGALTLGIADGVGGWQDQGVDAGLMSHRLMELVREESAKVSNCNILPLDLLNRAYERVKNDRSVQAGSTTACILSFCLEGDGGGGGSFLPPPRSEGSPTQARPISLPLPAPSLAAVNVGDSGFMIVRPTSNSDASLSQGKIIFLSEPLQHHGGAPFQLAIIPSHLRHLDAVENDPKDGQQIHVPLSLGDIIILGTDGLLDNLAPSQIESIVNQELARSWDDPHHATAAICRTLVQRAIAGPKPDDISIIVARLESSDRVRMNGAGVPMPSSPSPSVSMNSSSPSISISTITDELSEVSIPPTVMELPCVSSLPVSAASFAPQDACLVQVAKIFSQSDLEGEKLAPLSRLSATSV